MAERDRAIQAFRVLNDIVGDLIAATRVPDIFARLPKVDERAMRITIRMCFAYIILTLAKYVECYERFRSVIPQEVLAECKKLHNELLSRGVIAFRNKAIGHIWDNELDRPLSAQELDDFVAKVANGDTDAFITWINDQKDNAFPKTVIGIAEAAREALRVAHKLTDEEIFQ